MIQPLLALAGLVTATSQTIVQEYYVPMPEAQIRQTFLALASNTGTTMDTTVSMVAAVSGTKIVYDHWEDGYEVSLDNPVQSTTQVWGDGNDANGKPPGFATDPVGLSSGTVIALRNNVVLPRNPTSFLYDGRDRVGATRGIVMSRSSWATTPGAVLADATEVYSTIDWGTDFIIPVGEDEIFPTPLTASMFELCSLFVQASQSGTTVRVDRDGNGSVDATVVLGQGETYYLERGLLKGATVAATKPVQVDIITGDIGGNYETRWYTVAPTAQWGSRYYSPVGTASDGDDAYVFLYNPATSAITVNVNTAVGASAFSIPAKSNYRYLMPQDSGASFIGTDSTKPFYAIECVGAKPTANNVHDWGFSLVQESDLTTSLSLGWGPGSSEAVPTVNGNPAWVTPVKSTTLYVDFNGDRAGSQTDPLGGKCDLILPTGALQVQRLFDPDKDNTGMRIYTTDGTLIAGAWGQDPATAGPGNPYLDAGTTIPSFPVPVVRKASVTFTDNAPVGLSVGDVLEYAITMDNAGLVALGNIVVVDNLPAQISYVAGSTTRDGVAIPDSGSGTPFPLDAGGFTVPVLQRGQTTTLKYRATIVAAGSIANTVATGYSGVTSTNTVSVPGGGVAAVINFTTSTGTTVTTYSAGDGIYVTMTDADANTSATTVQTVTVLVRNSTTGDYESIVLTETGVNTGIFRNTTALPSSSAAGTNVNDGTLNVFAGNSLSVSYTDPVYGETATAASSIGTPSPSKILYLSADGVGSPDQDLDRIDPVATNDTTTSSTANLTSGTATIAAAATTTGSSNGPISSLSVAHTTGTGSNRLMLVALNYEDDGTAGINISGVTYGGVPLSLVLSRNSTQEVVTQVWRLVAPASGTANVVVTGTGIASDDSLHVGVTTFTGVDQTTPLGTAVANSGTGTAASVSVTAAAGDLVYATMALDDSRTSTSAAGQTDLFNAIQGTANNDGVRAVASTKAGAAGTVTSSWTTGSDAWSTVSVPIKPATTSSSLTFTQTPVLAENLILPAGAVLSGNVFYTVASGTMPASPAISAVLRYGSTTVATSNSTSQNGTSLTFGFPALSSAVTIPSGQALSLDVVNSVAGLSFRIDYDSVTKNSRITIPTTTVIHTDSIGVYDAPYPGGSLVTNPFNGQVLYVRTVVGDPFGAYDITSVGLVIDGPGTADDITTSLGAANVVATTASAKTYEYVWRSGATTGAYSIAATGREGFEGTVTSQRSTSVNMSFRDVGTPSTTEFFTTGGASTLTYAPGESVVIRVTDLDQNQNPAQVETVIVTLTSSTGDTETITLTETGVNTGVFTATVPASATVAGSNNNGTIYAPAGSALSVSYVDIRDSNDVSTDTATVPAATAVDGISLTKTLISPASGQVTAGQAVQFRLRVVNTGGTALSTVSLTDTFPTASFTFVSASTTPSSASGGTLTWSNVGPLAIGQAAEIFVNFTANSVSGTVTNNATATGGSSTSNSSASVIVTRPRVTVSKTVVSPASGTAGKGDNVVFSIAVQNTGSTAIPNLPLEDMYSNETFEYVSASLAPNAVGPGSLLWNDITGSGSLAVGATQTISVTLKVKGQANPAINTVAVNYATDSNGDAVPATSGSASLVTTAGSVRGQVLEDKGASGFGGGDTALANVVVSLYSDPNADGNPADGTLLAVTTTAADGFYEFLGLALGSYVVVESDPTGYNSVADTQGANDNRIAVTLTSFTPSTGNNFLDLYIDPSLYANIEGQVRNDTNANGVLTDVEAGIGGLTIELYTDPNGDGNPSDGTLYATTLTSTSATVGSYAFRLVPPGSYVVIEADPSGFVSTGDKTFPNDNRIAVTVAASSTSSGNDFLDTSNTAALGTVGNLVWADINNNGLFDSATESGIANVALQLFRTGDNPLATQPYRVTSSGLGGVYSFANVVPGSYFIYIPASNFSTYGALVTAPLSSVPTAATVNATDNDDNGVQAGGRGTPVSTPSFSVVANVTNNTVDFGFVPNASLGTISGTVLEDTNNDNTGDAGMAGVTITLLTDPNGNGLPDDGANAVSTTTTTAANGSYSFTGLAPGYYIVTQTPVSGYLFVSDSDGGVARRVSLQLNAGATATANFVEERPGIVTGHLYIDTNGNGTQQAGEPPISGAQILITDSNNATQTVTTDTNGNWTATVPPGTTIAKVVSPPANSQQTEGNDPTTVTANPNATVSAGNDGYYIPATLTGRVYRDIVGNSTEDGTDSGIQGVIVRITDSLGVVRNVTTNASGDWTVSVPPGSTTVDVLELDASFPTGAVQREGTDPTVVVAVAGTSTSAGKDGYYFPATVTGHVYLDANGNGVQDPGETSLAAIDILVTSSTGATQTVETNSSGNWSASVPPGTTTALVVVTDPQFPTGANQTQGDNPTSVVAVAAQVVSAGIDGYFLPATVIGHLYIDTNGNGVEDSGEPPLPAVSLLITDSLNVQRTVVTDANGNWTVSVPPGTTIADIVDSDPDIPANSVRTQGTDPTTVTAVAGSTANAGKDGFYVPAKINGHLYVDTNGNGSQQAGEPNLPNVDVVITTSTGSTLRVTTDVNGNWTASVPPGTTVVDIDNADPQYPTGYQQTEGSDPNNVTAVAGVDTPAGIDGFYQAAILTGHLFADTNGNGIEDAGEPGLAGVHIQITDSTGVVRTVTTDGAGNWTASVPPGSTVVDIVDTDPAIPAGATRTVGQDPVTVTAVAGVSTPVGVATGYYQSATVTGLLYLDRNGNGTRDSGELPIADIDITITDSTGATRTVVTNALGVWSASVPPGTTTAKVVTTDAQFPANVTQTEGTDPTTVTAVAGSSVSAGNDGYFLPATVAGLVYRDVNGNGVRDPGEPGLQGVIVRVTDSLGVSHDVLTATNGSWTLTVPPGTTTVDVVTQDISFPAGGQQREGTDPNTVTAVAGSSVDGGTDGYYFPGTVTGFVYLDTNGNGTQEPNETGIGNLDIEITDSNGTVQVVSTAISGSWSAIVPPGATTVRVVTTDPQFPIGATLTTGTDPRTVTAVAAGNVSAGVHGYYVAATVTGVIYLDTNGNGTQQAGEPGIAGVNVLVTDSLGNPQTVATGVDGRWTASVPPGTTTADLDQASPAIPSGAVQTQGNDPTTVTAVAGATVDGGKDGFYLAATVSGHLFVDTNGDGVQNAGEPNLPNVDVIVTDSNGVVHVVTSGPTGNWSVSVPPGATLVDVDQSDPQFPAGGTLSAGADPVTVTATGGTTVTVDPIGYEILGVVTGHLYYDINGDNDQDPGEQDMAGIDVVVTDSLGAIHTVETDASGNWSVNVPPGSTSAKVNTLDPQFPVGAVQREGTDPTVVTAVAGTTVSAGNDGYFIATSVTGTVFVDLNHNGVRDAGEPGLAGVSVQITDSNSQQQTVITNDEGVWVASVPPGSTTCTIIESGPAFPAGSQKTFGLTTETKNVVTGPPVNFTGAGYYFTGTISGHLFSDTNGNGQEDEGEPGLGGISLTIVDSLGETQTVVTDPSGNWAATVPPGTVTVDVVNAGLPAGAVLTSGADPVTLTAVAGQNTPVTTATGYYQSATVTGHLYVDTNGNGVQDGSEPNLPGVNVFISDSNGGSQTAVTDANGNWSVSVPPGATLSNVDEADPQYPAGAMQTQGEIIGNTTAVAGETRASTPVGLFIPAVIKGHLYLDLNGNGTQDFVTHNLANVDVIVTDSLGNTQRVTTDANGDWTATVPPGPATATVDSNDPQYPTGYTVTEGAATTLFNALAGQTLNSTPVGFYLGATVSGHLYVDTNGNGQEDAGEPGVGGVTITVTDSLGNPHVTQTDASGNWSVAVPPGSTVVDVDQNDPQFPAGGTLSQGSDPVTVVAVGGENTSTGPIGYKQIGTLTGHLYVDTNGNGTQDSGEPDLANVDVFITDALNNVQVVVTDATGNWTASVPPGETTVKVSTADPQFPAGAVSSEGTDPTVVTAEAGASVSAGIDGFYLSTSVTGAIFVDLNHNGVRDGNEPGLAGVTVEVTDVNGATQQVVTNELGVWTAVVPPGSTTATVVETGPAFPSGFQRTVGDGSDTVTAVVNSSVAVEGNGYYFPGTVNGSLFSDTNGNGVRDPGEPGLEGINIIITDSLGDQHIVTTDEDGNWSVSVPPGTTLVDIDNTGLPTGSVQTVGNDPVTVTAVSGQATPSGSSAGFFQPGTVSGHLYADTNGNGVEDSGEPPLAGVNIFVRDSNGNTSTVVTGPNGNWVASVPPGVTVIDIDEADAQYPAGSTQTEGSPLTTVTAVAGNDTPAGSAGFFTPAIVTGHLYLDLNGNGTQDFVIHDLANVNILITDSLGNTQTVVTDAEGDWSASVPPGLVTASIDTSDPEYPAGSTVTQGSLITQITAVAGTTTGSTPVGFFFPATVYGHLYVDTNGNGTQDLGEPNLANVNVRVTSAINNTQTVVSDVDGNWTATVPPGNTIVTIDKTDTDYPTGFTQTEGSDPSTVFAVGSLDTFAGNDGFYQPATVSGHLFTDVNGNGTEDSGEPGLAGVDILITDSNGNTQTVTTDSNGNWTASVPPGQTIIDIVNSDPQIPAGATQTTGTDPVTVNAQAGQNTPAGGSAGFYLASSINGLVYTDTNGNGFRDAGEPGLGGVSVEILDSNNNTQTVVTDVDGLWTASVPPGTTQVTVVTATLPFTGMVQKEGTNPSSVTAVAGQSVNAGNDGYYRAAEVQGFVYRDVNGDGAFNGIDEPLANVIVRVTDSIGVVRDVTTNSAGIWTASVPPGETTADILELDATFPNGATRREGSDPTTVTAVAGTSVSAGNDGYYFPATITGLVFLDVNGNGTREQNEPGLANIDVIITDSNGAEQTVVTDTAGLWSAIVPPGSTQVQVVTADPDMPTAAVQTAGTNPNLVNAVANVITPAGSDGYYVAATVTGVIYADTNGNGTQQGTEAGIANVTVLITDSLGNTQTVTTGSDGRWTAAVPPGATIVDITDTNGQIPAAATQTQGTDPTPVTAVAGVIADAGKDGFYVSTTLGGHLFVDNNGNGIQDPGDPPLPNVDIIVTDSNGDTHVVTTDSNGDWTIQVPPGSTIVDVDQSDPDFPAGGTLVTGTDPVTVNTTTTAPTVIPPLAYEILGTVTGHLYLDVNDSGTQDAGEPNLANINVVITDSLGQPHIVETDGLGNWTVSVPTGTTTINVDESDPQFPVGAVHREGQDPNTVEALAGTIVDGGIDGYFLATSVTGVIYNDLNGNGVRDAGEPGLANVPVQVTAVNGSQFVLTNGDGVWVASVPPGPVTATVNEADPLFTPDFERTEGEGTDDVDAVDGSSVAVETNGYYFPGSISGHLYIDVNGNGTQDPGEPNLSNVDVVVTNSLGTPITLTTDVDGNWSTPIAPGAVNVNVDETDPDFPAGATQTDGLDPNTVTVISGQNTFGGNDGYYIAATVTGHLYVDVNGNGIQDAGEPDLGGVNVFVAGSNGITVTVVTDASGNWTASVAPGATVIDIDESDQQFPAGAVQRQGQPLTTVTAVANSTVNGGVNGYFVPVIITGHLYLDLNGNGNQDFTVHNLANVDILVTDSNGNTQRVTTDSNGDWTASVPPGPAYATVDAADPEYPTGSVITQGALTTVFDAVVGDDPIESIPVGFFFPATVSGHLYIDSNGNGRQDTGEPNIAGVDVLITTALSNTFTVTTDANGIWTATVPPGSTIADIQESDPQYPGAGYVRTEGDDPTTVTAVASINTSAGNDGFYRSGTISGHLFTDLNGNGVEDLGEPGLGGVDILITDVNGNTQVVTTDGDGNWTAIVPPGNTIVDIVDADPQIPAGAVRTAGSDPVTVVAVDGQNTPVTNSVGYFSPGTIRGFVRTDNNNDGTPDAGIPNVLIGLFDGSTMVSSTTTAADGSYSFTGLAPKDYVITELQPEGYLSVSDADGGDLDEIGPISLGAGVTIENMNFLERPLKTPNTFADWQAANPLDGENGPGDNPDGDLSNNLIEYAFGQDPASGAGNPFCLVPSLTEDGAVDAVYTRTAGGATDVTYDLQSLGDLMLSPGAWSTVPLTPANYTITDNGDGSETVRILNLQDLTNLPTSGFVRIRVSLNLDADPEAEAIAFTEVGGWVETTWGTDCRTYSNSFVSCPVFSGVVDAVNGQQIDLTTSASGLNLANALTPGSAYYLEVVSGDLTGHRFDVSATGTGSLTLANATSLFSGTAPFNTVAGALPAALAGDHFVIRVHSTLGQMFPVGAFTPTGSQETADQVQVFANGAFINYWLFENGGSPRWVRVDDSSLSDQAGTIIPPGQGTFIRCLENPASLVAFGKVRANDFVLPMQAGNNLVRGGYPVDESPLSRGMTIPNGFTGNRDFKKADEIFIWRGDTVVDATGYDTYFLLNGAPTQPALRRWAKVGDSSITPQDGNLLFKRDNSAFIKLNTPLPAYRVSRPWQP